MLKRMAVLGHLAQGEWHQWATSPMACGAKIVENPRQVNHSRAQQGVYTGNPAPNTQTAVGPQNH
mgnify:CR=1 FL=1